MYLSQFIIDGSNRGRIKIFYWTLSIKEKNMQAVYDEEASIETPVRR